MAAIFDVGSDLFDQLFRASDAGLALVDPSGIILNVNPAFAALIGQTAESLAGVPVADLMPAGTVTGRGAIPSEWLHETGRSSIRITCRELEKGGSVLTAIPTVTPQEASRIQGLEESLSLAMQGAKLGWWTRDFRTGKVEWSPELEAIFGLAPGSFAQNEEAFFDLVLDEDKAIVSNAVEGSIRNGSDYRMVFRFRRADGSIGWMEGRGRTIRDADGKPSFMAGVGIDITEQQTTEQALA